MRSLTKTVLATALISLTGSGALVLAVDVAGNVYGNSFTYDATVYTYDDVGVVTGANVVDGKFDTASEAEAACQEARDKEVQTCEENGGVVTQDPVTSAPDTNCNHDEGGFSEYFTPNWYAPRYQYIFLCEAKPQESPTPTEPVDEESDGEVEPEDVQPDEEPVIEEPVDEEPVIEKPVIEEGPVIEDSVPLDPEPEESPVPIE
jgi:hypothetical protein